MNVSRHHNIRAALFAASAFGALGLAQAAAAQDAAAPAETAAAPQDSETADIVVTGIRASLESATNAKKNAVAFGDSIFAEDIGKLPATNLAETLNRMPGVRLNRDINGEGTQVAIRGLGPSFTRVLLNGSQLQVASDGGTNGGSANREVDLDFFPSELFTRLDLAKSPSPSTLEGGIAGTVNLRNARPFDKEGTHVTVVAQGQYTDNNDKFSPRGAIVASHTTDTFGILVGVAGVKTKTRVDGFESVGWTDGNLGTGDAGGNNFSWASVVPNNTGHGLVAGQPVDVVATSGLTRDQLSTALIPRLGRKSLTEGDRSRISALASLEWRPSDELHFALDGIWAKSKRDYSKVNMNWQVRNSGPGTSAQSTGGMVPIDLTVDDNGVVTSGTFANSSYFLEASLFKQTTKFWNVNPSVSWQPTEDLKVDLSANWSKSRFFREQPTWAFQTTPQSGVETYYDNTGGDYPSITSNLDLNDPNNGSWQWYRQNIQLVRRKTETKGAHLDVTYGDDMFNVKVGGAYDQATRSIRAYDNSTAYQLSVCGTGCTGATGTVPTSAIAQYLRSSSTAGFIVPDFDALKQATNYASYRDSAPEARGAVTGGATGDMDEKVWGAYFELNGVTTIAGRDLHINTGMRYAHTDQLVVGPSQVGTAIVDITSSSTYENFLPSINLTYDVADNVKLRASASRTMTRPDAGAILPGITFSDPSALTATAGNPNLKPYTSDNYDLGGEIYTGGIGYVGVSLFMKNIQGFTVTTSEQVAFGSLNIPFDSLISTQQNALNDRSLQTGIPVAQLPITVNRPVNLRDLKIKGIEATWVQPLDFLVKGLGFSANGTYLKQSSSSGLVATGVSPWSYNLQGFYENGGLSVSVNYVWNDEAIAVNGPQNGINGADLKSDARGQLDMSAGYQLPFFNKALRLTLDVLNITDEPIRTTFEYSNAAYSVYYPGRTVLAGIRANF
ncbi:MULTISPECIES: TonB-dependent receptor [Sphingobium]|jgi:TonB-dependent receptor|uniref:TonB-dependent receptor n=1 Tax=Sphingobium yanoikuyae TaxID=13690 RepID=A0A084EGN3_SPHYA|nr:TonB-dependent receptor [Sphingobium yanoikuyae]KEZ17125.1 TonB-dependent receptor precursor [Sphingobium yanoikuyae]KFD28936.1 TonB-dependent receptor [Sphingobium yanoikuyae]KZC81409.1 TonB-dependent receptor [Sphingobium yanoikuyae]MDV3478799.1 TonB-dependent receptor [Sphingobium yanoikuyae]